MMIGPAHGGNLGNKGFCNTPNALAPNGFH